MFDVIRWFSFDVSIIEVMSIPSKATNTCIASFSSTMISEEAAIVGTIA